MDKIVFLGDSITFGFRLLLKHDNISNMGVRGDRTREILNRIEGVVRKNPDKLFIMVGLNDFLTNERIYFKDEPIDIKSNYDNLLNELTIKLPHTKIYIMSILPITDGEVINKNQVTLFNQAIDSLNEMIKSLVEFYQLVYLPINKDFKDLGNQLKREYTTDGLHLSNLGYELFYQKIFNFLK